MNKIKISIIILLISWAVIIFPQTNQEKEALSKAIRDGDIITVKRMVEKGFNVNTMLTWRSPLSMAIAEKKYDICYFLIANGVKINSPDKYGKTYLDTAVRCNAKSVVQLLVKKSAKVNISNDNGVTPMHLAVQINYDMAKIYPYFRLNKVIFPEMHTTSNRKIVFP
jgi:ankyrin repeat protein